MKRYLFARQNHNDGGWGLHIEGESTAYGTTMTYVVLRLLGVSEEDERMIKARGMLHKLGGAVNGPHWAKFLLAVLGLMEWEAVNPVPPELWYVRKWKWKHGAVIVNAGVQASPGLGSVCSMAMVDTHTDGLSPNVLYLLLEIRVSSEFPHPPYPPRDLYTIVFRH